MTVVQEPHATVGGALAVPAPRGGFRPIALLDIELTEPFPDLAELSGAHSGVRALVRMHHWPLGIVELALDGTVAANRSLVEQALAPQIARHLADDGPDQAGQEPACTRRRAELLRDAPPISVVVPTRERPELLRTLLRSLLAVDYPMGRLEVIVVDNAPITSRTADLVRREFETAGNVRYIREPAAGGSNARNRGTREASADLIAFVDDDIQVDRNWLSSLAAGFSTGSNVGAVSGPLIPSEIETPAQRLLEDYGGFARGFDLRILDVGPNMPGDEPLFPFIAGTLGTGGNMAFRTSVLDELGGFDPALGTATPTLGGEDRDLLLRTVLAGHSVVYHPAALVRHRHHREYDALKRRIYGYGVGLTAGLTKLVLEQPSILPDLARKVPRGLAFALSSGSPKHENKSSDYPLELTRLELAGMAYGPLAYLRSRRTSTRRRGRRWPGNTQ